jgi:hypothetical protein
MAERTHAIWSDLYDGPERLVAAFGHERLFAPAAYGLVRRLQRVPIVHVEALAMASWFPVCWERRAEGVRLCVLRSLMSDADGAQPPGSPVRLASLPLALRAYPVALVDGLGEQGAIIVERGLADRPTDAGAPFVMPDGKPSKGLLHRYRAGLIARHAAGATVEIGEALAAIGAFQPWPLVFEIDGRTTVAIRDLLHVDMDRLAPAALRRLLARFGADLAVLLTAHRMSLFRINALLAAARTTARSTARTVTRTGDGHEAEPLAPARADQLA